MEKSYYHLDVPYAVSDKWKECVQDFNAKQIILDPKVTYLSSETKAFLENIIGVTPVAANVWSWLPMHAGLWHTDQRYGIGPEVAINFLLQGDSGTTEWAEAHKLQLDDTEGLDPIYGTADTRYRGYCLPSYRAKLKPNTPRLDKISVPHRVNRSASSETRWTYRVFLKELGKLEVLSWATAVQLFSEYFQP